ncbi:relaxase/mobilization nuclease domain-containing protein [Scytonema millei]|uniref:Relaxase/mobilization nuclease domain-containing protein n=1 Tax=Scytonema millei VB511283 TaxID=1245923 RepID=A0A9X5E838_9CYAN|nr:relaxase/mobilization nuclease domain-containing protein [Scytonema millei]NHC35959.1 relaxase/mobilization nuclease domain-containing protein [Scytonema millei VB511283]
MIGNISKGRGFRGCLSYLLEKEQAELIGGNMLGENARELAAEFKLSRQLNPDIKQPVFHASLSLPKHEDYAEHVDEERWNSIAADYLQQMGFTRNQYIVVRHFDRDHDHIHIVAARVKLDGTVVDDSWDYRKSQDIIRSLEREYNLTPVLSSWEVERRGITKGQYEQQRREVETGSTPTPNVKERIAELADQVLPTCTTPEQFIEKMQAAGVQIQTRTQRDGSISGISYQYTQNGVTVATPGNKLGTDYSWNGIQRRIKELTPQLGDAELLAAQKKVAAYFAKLPTHPNEQELQRFQRDERRLAALYDDLFQQTLEKQDEIEQASWLSRLLPKYKTDLASLEKILAQRDRVYESWMAAGRRVEEWHSQKEEYRRWQSSPATKEMEQLREYLNTPQVQTRLSHIKEEQRQERERQQEGREISIAVQQLFRLIGTQPQPDGSLMLEGNRWRLMQRGHTVSVSVKADNREILRVEGEKTVVFNPTREERERMHSLRSKVSEQLQQEKIWQRSLERKQSRGFSL